MYWKTAVDSGELHLEGTDFRREGVFALCGRDEHKERIKTHPLMYLETQSGRSEVWAVGWPVIPNLSYKNLIKDIGLSWLLEGSVFYKRSKVGDNNLST